MLLCAWPEVQGSAKAVAMAVEAWPATDQTGSAQTAADCNNQEYERQGEKDRCLAYQNLGLRAAQRYPLGRFKLCHTRLQRFYVLIDLLHSSAQPRQLRACNYFTKGVGKGVWRLPRGKLRCLLAHCEVPPVVSALACKRNLL